MNHAPSELCSIMPKIKVACPTCGNDVWMWPYRIPGLKYCSRECKKKSCSDIFTCEYCLKKFKRYKCNVKEGKRVFCGKECADKWKSENIRGDNHPLRRKAFVVCAQCGKESITKPALAKRATKHFCNKKCMSDYEKTFTGESAKHWKGGKQELACKKCGKAFFVDPGKVDERYFCSKKCADEWRSENIRGENNPIWKPRIEVPCIICGTKILKTSGQLKRLKYIFCSRECHRLWQSQQSRGSNNPAWRGGKNTKYGPHWKHQRELARKRDNYKCQRCGRDESDFDRKLAVHHIKRFAEFAPDDRERANGLENLISLCQYCHPVVEREGYNKND